MSLVKRVRTLPMPLSLSERVRVISAIGCQPEGTSESCTTGGAVSMPDTVKLCRVWLPA